MINPDVCAGLVKAASSQNEDTFGDSKSLPDSGNYEETETRTDIVLLTLDTMLTLERYIQKMGVILSEFLQSHNVITSALSRGLASTQRDQVQISLSLVVKAGRLPEFPLTLLGDSVVAQNAEKRKRGHGAVGPLGARTEGGGLSRNYVEAEYSRWGSEGKENKSGENVLRESSISNLQGK